MGKQKIDKRDIDLYKRLRESPVFFVEFMWVLTPERDNAKFVKGKHISWQQHDLLLAVEKALKNEAPRRISVRSGHGTGKSCVLSWLILWYLFCYKDAQIPCTAPTADQMYDVLWKELAKWYKKMPESIQSKYDWSASYMRVTESPETWFARARTARKEAPEALQGIHGDYVMMIIDEASGVANEIFEAAEGALTDKNILVLMIGNPTRLIGQFYDSHNKDKEAWQTLQFSGAESPLVDKIFSQRLIDKYGEDSDEYRIRVLGEFPKSDAVDDQGYVPLLLETDLHETIDGPFGSGKRMGIDPSGEGDDETVWVVRDHFKAKVVAREKISTPKSIAQKTLTLMQDLDIKDYNVFCDNFGEGANVAKELALSGKNIKGINVGDDAEDKEKYLNMRAEAFWRNREWLRTGGTLVTNEGWEELLYIRYRAELSGKLRIMSKKDMRKLGIKSPNIADALMLTFTQSEYMMDEYRSSTETAFVFNE